MTEKCSIPYDTISRMSVSSHPLFAKCCFCIPLRTGCFLLGYLNLVMTALQTLALIALTTYIGVSTHGFDHFDYHAGSPIGLSSDIKLLQDSTDMPVPEDVEQPFLTRIGFILAVLLVANLSWMIINIACLVGLHKKSPGPIRVYVGFATARLMLSFAGFIYLVMTNKVPNQSIITHGIDLGLTAYFVLVYYIYAVQIEKEREAEIAQPATVNNVFLYPSKLDKSHLVA